MTRQPLRPSLGGLIAVSVGCEVPAIFDQAATALLLQLTDESNSVLDADVL